MSWKTCALSPKVKNSQADLHDASARSIVIQVAELEPKKSRRKLKTVTHRCFGESWTDSVRASFNYVRLFSLVTVFHISIV